MMKERMNENGTINDPRHRFPPPIPRAGFPKRLACLHCLKSMVSPSPNVRFHYHCRIRVLAIADGRSLPLDD
jgi:hypothetical protein